MRVPGLNRLILAGICGFLIVFFLYMSISGGDGQGWKRIVTSDGRGYYAYLPAFIIDGDAYFSKVGEREAKLTGTSGYKPEYLVVRDGRPVNKYFAGEALLLLPFFLTGLLLSVLTGSPADGYSFFFQISVGIGAIVYLMLGLFFLSRILEYFNTRKGISSLVMVTVFFGTNLFYYGILQTTMSHLYSFFAINGFLCATIRAIRSWNRINAAGMGLFLGLVFLIRPTNLAVLLLIPFLAGNYSIFLNFLKGTWKAWGITLIFLAAFIAVAAIQPFLWRLQTGHWFVWSYADEGFNFTKPQVLYVLFSYRKGLFIYTPLMLVAWTGLILLYFKNRFRFFTMLLFLTVSTWIIASWWNWYYGDGFGLRAFIDYYGIYAILFAILINPLKKKIFLFAALLVIFPLIFLNLFQTWQYANHIIHPNSMNREKFRYVFLRTDSAYRNCLGGNREIPGFTIDMTQAAATFFNDFESAFPGWDPKKIIQTGKAYSASHAGLTDGSHPFSPGLYISTGRLGKRPSAFYLEGEVMVLDSAQGSGNNVLLVISIDGIASGQNHWQGFRIFDTPQDQSGKWIKCRFSASIPAIGNPDGILKVFLWNTGKSPVLVDDFTLKFYREREKNKKGTEFQER